MPKQAMKLTTIATLILLISACADNPERAKTENLDEKEPISNGLSREAVRKVIEANKSEITGCYEKALADNPNLSGKSIFEWEVLENGSVGKVGIQYSTLPSNSLERCIKESIKSWQFPPLQGVSSTFASYPFIFNVVPQYK